MINKLGRTAKSGPAVLAIGLGVLGLSSYAFLMVSGRVLGDADHAPLGALWILIFLLAPAFFYPLEQEVTRAVASRRVHGHGFGPVVRRAGLLALALCAVLIVAAIALSPLYIDDLFNGDEVLLAALLLALVTFGAEYLVKGVLAGSNHLRAYAALIAIEGMARAGAAIGFAFGGIESAAPYGLAIGAACAVAVVCVAPKQIGLLTPGPSVQWRELSASLGNLVAASLLSQTLTNAAPLVVKYMAPASQQAIAGAFVKAVVITRIPVFLFQAVQAVLLPRLTRFAAAGEQQGFDRTLGIALAAVLGIGLLGCIGSAALGPQLMALFGSDSSLTRADLFYLAAGNALLLMCLTVAQGLVAIGAQSKTVIGYGAGVAAFAASYALPGNIVLRSEWALIIGSGVGLIVMWFCLRRQPLAAADELELTEIG